MPPPRGESRQRARTAYAMAAVYGSMPLASRIFLGAWDFEGAGALAALCLIAGVYFHLAGPLAHYDLDQGTNEGLCAVEITGARRETVQQAGAQREDQSGCFHACSQFHFTVYPLPSGVWISPK